MNLNQVLVNENMYAVHASNHFVIADNGNYVTVDGTTIYETSSQTGQTVQSETLPASNVNSLWRY